MAGERDQLRASLAEALDAAAAAERQRTAAASARVAAAEAVEQALRTGEELEEARRRLGEAEQRHQRAEVEAEAASQQVRQLGEHFVVADPDPATLLGQVPATRPLTLLPLRLETRWSDGGLLLRIYPDELHSDTHEPELTAAEAEWGAAFWSQAEGASAEEVRRAWAVLAQRFGPRRAAYVRTATEPGSADPGRRAASWTRAPHTRVLPDRFVALGYRDGKRVVTEWGAAVPDTIATGPRPGEDGSAGDPLLPPLDDGMRWMVEFDEAEKVGMAMRIDPGGEERIDRLVVLGVKASLDGGRSAARLAELVEAHRYTDGVSLLAPGAASNNAGEGAAAFHSGDGLGERSGRLELAPPLFAAGDGSDGDALATALGLPAGTFARVAGADGRHGQDAQAMNAALWPGTLGYYLAQMMAAEVSDEDAELARRHFRDFVRGRGAVPTVRFGRQPYGVVPATALSLYAAAAQRPVSSSAGPAAGSRGKPFEERLAELLRQILPLWRDSLAAVPSIGGGDPDADLLAVLGQQGVSARYAVRAAVGRDYWTNLWWFMGLGPFADWSDEQRRLARATLERLGVAWEPRLLEMLFVADAELNGPHVEPGPTPLAQERLSGVEPLADDYIGWLLGADYASIRDELYPTEPPNALLYLLLRHSLLTALGDAGRLALLGADVTGAAELGARLREPELIDIGRESTMTPRRLLELEVAQGVKASSVAVALQRAALGRPWELAFEPPRGPAVEALEDLTAALGQLRDRPTAFLERAMAESLDLCTHRLDAWVSSLAAQRLARARQARREEDVCIGAYGWLEGLRPTRPAGGVERDPEAQPWVDPDNLGFVHAPSLGQAATAAVLRAGHLSHDRGEEGLLAIDLSSRRVRIARELLEGVREGQPLGALLGYRFERGLHERHRTGVELDRFVFPFRRLAPLTAGKRDPEDEGSVEAIATANVVDGLALLERWKAEEIDFGTPPLPAAGSGEREEIEAELRALAEAADALGDALLAEGVHQAVQGNAARSAATLDAVATGEAPPPELQVADSARTGVGVTHRVAMAFGGPAPAAIPAAQVGRAREDAEPTLAAWAKTYFGDLSEVACEARYAWQENGTSREDSRFVGFGEAKLSALDLLIVAVAGEGQQRSELELRLLHAARSTRPSGVPADAEVGLDTTAVDPAAPAGTLNLDQLVELARAGRDLVAGSRALTPADLSPAGDEGRGASLAVADLEARADRAAARLEAVHNALAAPAPSLGARRGQILDAAYLGVQGAVPVSATGSGPEEERDLEAQAESIAGELAKRLARLAELAAPAVGTDADRIRHHIERIELALGKGLPVLPRFRLDAARGAELDRALAASAALQGGDPSQAGSWLARAARVREGAARLDAALMYGEALGTVGPSLRVAQLPFQPGERWAALPPPAGEAIQGGRVSFVIQGAPGFEADAEVAGLLVDEWVEVVPAERETTGVTFHFDAPGAEAPQAILLALHPAPHRAEGWDLDTLAAVVEETLELAMLRTVDSDALGGAGQFLPALWFASNAEGHSPSTDFLRNVVPEEEVG